MQMIHIPEGTKTIVCDGNLCSFIFNNSESKQVHLNSLFCSNHPKVYFHYNNKDVYCNYCGFHFFRIDNKASDY